MYVMGFSVPSGNVCDKTAPTPVGLASVDRTKARFLRHGSSQRLRELRSNLIGVHLRVQHNCISPTHLLPRSAKLILDSW